MGSQERCSVARGTNQAYVLCIMVMTAKIRVVQAEHGMAVWAAAAIVGVVAGNVGILVWVYSCSCIIGAAIFFADFCWQKKLFINPQSIRHLHEFER